VRTFILILFSCIQFIENSNANQLCHTLWDSELISFNYEDDTTENTYRGKDFAEVAYYISNTGRDCDVAEFYQAIEPDYGVKVLTTSGDIEDAELILVPARIEEGTYEIEITRKGSNIYKLEGTKYYIETRYCYEYATYDDAILKVDNNYGYTKGKIYFD